MIISIFYFLAPFFVGIIAIFLLLKFSEKTNFLVDAPEGDVLKIHKKSIPLLGGLAMATAAVVGAMIFPIPKITIIFLALVPIFFLGFYDDLKWKHVSTIKPLLKFTLLIVCAFVPSVILSLAGIRFNFIPHISISIFLGFVYIFVCLNAVNYQDGMDALASVEVFISLIGFMILSIMMGATLPFYISLLFSGALLAFLVFNFPPAKIFMGDSGAYSLGFILAVLAMLFSKPYNFYSTLAPIF